MAASLQAPMGRARSVCAIILGVGLLAAACVGLAGCGKSGPSLSKANMQAFNSAPPAIKQAWEKALEADKANDYLNAGMAFFALQKENLTPEQAEAVRTALVALNLRMCDAAYTKGDESAKKALETFREMNTRRPR